MVDTKSIEVSAPRSLGAEYVCHSMWRQLGFNTVLRKQGISEQVLPLLEALVVGRLIEPGREGYGEHHRYHKGTKKGNCYDEALKNEETYYLAKLG